MENPSLPWRGATIFGSSWRHLKDKMLPNSVGSSFFWPARLFHSGYLHHSQNPSSSSAARQRVRTGTSPLTNRRLQLARSTFPYGAWTPFPETQPGTSVGMATFSCRRVRPCKPAEDGIWFVPQTMGKVSIWFQQPTSLNQPEISTCFAKGL